jgi:polysaccharide deacetylase 2 family uncharacterized protein YibQ
VLSRCTRHARRGLYLTAILSLVVCWASAVVAAPALQQTQPAPVIAIIIDDLGNQLIAGRRVVDLPGPVACAFMPHTAHAATLARAAHLQGKEVMLHLPMQPMDMQRIAGPGEISLENGQAELRLILANDLASVPHAVGVNNHMGSLITRHPGHMGWLMNELAERGNLFFVDSFTSAASVAYKLARERGVPTVRRHVFLDDDPSPAAIVAQFQRLLSQARTRGYAVGIGHPYPATLTLLEGLLPALAEEGVQLVPVSTITAALQRGELQHELTAELSARNHSALESVPDGE